MAEIKLFNRWSTEGIKVNDIGLEPYINLRPIIVPRTGGRYNKSKVPIIERFMNKLMIPGHKAKKHKVTSGLCTGKGNTVYKLMEDALRKIEAKTKKNPIEVFIRALENAAPREEIITTEYGGARYPKAVECAPQRRIDYALRQMAQGSYQKRFNTKNTSANAIAEEIIAAYQLNPKSTAISKKLELERQADASR